MIDLDETLRADAERWRADLPPVADLDVLLADVDRAPRRRWLLPALAAAVVVGLAVVLTVWAARPAPTPTPTTPPPHGDAAAPSLSDITGVVWKDTQSTGTVVYSATTMRVFDGCTNGLYRLIDTSGTLAQGDPIGGVSACGGIAIPPGPAGAELRAAARRLGHFHDVVEGPAMWSRSGDTMTLTTSEGASVTLTTDGASAPQVVGTHWTLNFYADTDQDSHDAQEALTFDIDPDGTFEADLQCGSLAGYADVMPDSVRFTDVAGSLNQCLSNANAGASAVVLAVIEGGRADYAIRGTDLILSDADGRLLVYDAS